MSATKVGSVPGDLNRFAAGVLPASFSLSLQDREREGEREGGREREEREGREKARERERERERGRERGKRERGEGEEGEREGERGGRERERREIDLVLGLYTGLPKDERERGSTACNVHLIRSMTMLICSASVQNVYRMILQGKSSFSMRL